MLCESEKDVAQRAAESHKCYIYILYVYGLGDI